MQIQLSLFHDLQLIIQTSVFHRKYYFLFQSLDLSGFADRPHDAGRKGYSRHAMFRAMIVKHLERIKTIPELLRFLDAHPVLVELCGFTVGCLPDGTQLYRFLKTVNTSEIERVQYQLNQELIDNGTVSLDHFILDSKPVMAATRQNNFKNPKRNTRDKTAKPKRNPSATLGYYSYQEVSGRKDFIFFWGYRTHVIVSKEGVPLVSVTRPNCETDAKVAQRLTRKLKRVYKVRKGAFFIADAAYDEREFYNFIVNEMKGRPFIPLNPRNTRNDKTFGPHGAPICEAGFEMKSAGSFKEGLRRRRKFRCPIKINAHFAGKHPEGCPLAHPRFSQGAAYGCTKYLDITDDARSTVPRDTALYRNTFNLRTEIERYFARLGDREVEQTTHYAMRSIRNQMAFAHLTMSLVAHAAAVILEKPGKIRCYRTFADEAMTELKRTA